MARGAHFALAVAVLSAWGLLAANAGVDIETATSEAPNGDDGSMRAVILGAGTPNPSRKFSGPANAVVINGVSYIVDGGEGVVVRATQAADTLNLGSLKQENLSRLFITHLHSDHTVGLADFSITPWVNGREKDIRVWGPEGTKRMMGLLEEAYSEDITLRLRGLEPITPQGYHSVVVDVPAKGGEIYRDDNVAVTAFPVEHGEWKSAFGYKFVALIGPTAGRTIVFSGDTRPTPTIADNCDKCDVLVHEVYSTALYDSRPADWQKYYRHYHTSSAELAEIAKVAQPKVLVLNHHLLGPVTPEMVVAEVAAAGYTGRVVFGKDLDVY